MTGPKKQRSPKVRTLRRAAALLLLLAVCWATGLYGLLPRQGIYYSEETANMGRTSVILDMGRIPLKKTGYSRAYLCANDNGMLVALTRFYLLYGWVDYGFNALDCSREEPLHVSTYSISKRTEDGYGQIWYLYGRVDAAEGESLRASVGYEDSGGQWVSAEELELTRGEDWFEAGGRTYFIAPLPMGTKEDESVSAQVRVELLDGQGDSLWEGRVIGGGTGLG